MNSKKLKIIFWLIGFFFLHYDTVFPQTILLNVSYDPTRELFKEVNLLFQKKYKEETGIDVSIKQSHGGSSKQAGYVMAGLRADIVSLALAGDVDEIAKKKFIDSEWQKRKPNGSAPFTSVIVFLVRKSNPKKILDWADLIRPDVQVITPNPKTSGGGKWNFLSAYGYFLKKGYTPEKAEEALKLLYKNVPVMDTGARGSASTFIKRNMGDVLIIWENEAFLAKKETKDKEFELIYPSLSIHAEPVVSVVDRTIRMKGTEKIANDYIDFLYTDEAQFIIANSGYRPYNKNILEQFRNKFPKMDEFPLSEYFQNWQYTNSEIFGQGKLVDRVLP